jgi:hypothetical protein
MQNISYLLTGVFVFRGMLWICWMYSWLNDRVDEHYLRVYNISNWRNIWSHSKSRPTLRGVSGSDVKFNFLLLFWYKGFNTFNWRFWCCETSKRKNRFGSWGIGWSRNLLKWSYFIFENLKYWWWKFILVMQFNFSTIAFKWVKRLKFCLLWVFRGEAWRWLSTCFHSIFTLNIWFFWILSASSQFLLININHFLDENKN